MLVLIAGATGNIGQNLIDSLHSRGHGVRALARNLSKIDPGRRNKLHSSVESKTYYNIESLDRACSGVDAVICAYSGIAELQLDGQLLLLRAAERAGVTRFVAATWNYDWRNMKLGMLESYDPYICFRHHAELSSSIKPIYIFTGVLAEVLFSVPGHGDFSPKKHGVWDPERKSLEIWGSGEEPWHWTTERDAAEFTAEIITDDSAPKGGFWSVCSGVHTLKEISGVYEDTKGVKVDILIKGDVEQLRTNALEARREGSRQMIWGYIGWFYQLYTVDGTFTLKELDNSKLAVQTTSLENFLRENAEI